MEHLPGNSNISENNKWKTIQLIKILKIYVLLFFITFNPIYSFIIHLLRYTNKVLYVQHTQYYNTNTDSINKGCVVVRYFIRTL